MFPHPSGIQKYLNTLRHNLCYNSYCINFMAVYLKNIPHLAVVIMICGTLLQNGCAPALIPAGIAATGVVTSQDRSVSNNFRDKTILTKIKALFTQRDINNILVKVNVNVFEGRVMLTGYVAMPMYSEKAENMVWEIVGVKEVINEILVGDDEKRSSISDSWIESKLDTLLFMEKSVYSVNYTTQVCDGIVYLLGVAQDEQELEKVLYIASNVHGVSKVVNHVILKSDPRRNVT